MPNYADDPVIVPDEANETTNTLIPTEIDEQVIVERPSEPIEPVEPEPVEPEPVT